MHAGSGPGGLSDQGSCHTLQRLDRPVDRRFVDVTGRAHADLFLSIASLMGTPMSKFGHPQVQQSPIAAISG